MTKDIRFSEKKVDEHWKDQIQQGQGVQDPKPRTSSEEKHTRAGERQPKTSTLFLNFVTSLGIQALIHLGEMPDPQTQMLNPNLDAVKEILDLLIQIKEKTDGNLSEEEKKFFFSFLPELQLKFAQKI